MLALSAKVAQSEYIKGRNQLI